MSMMQTLRQRALLRSTQPALLVAPPTPVFPPGADPLASAETWYYDQQSPAIEPGEGGPAVAWRVFYDNTQSGIQAVDVQAAIDQLDDRLDLVTITGMQVDSFELPVLNPTANGVTFVYAGTTPGGVLLPATYTRPMQAHFLQDTDAGQLTFHTEGLGSITCRWDEPGALHRKTDGNGALVTAHMVRNPTGDAAQWRLYGYTTV